MKNYKKTTASSSTESSCIASSCPRVCVARIATVLWDADCANAHTLNIDWTMAYWNLLHNVPDPHSKDYGYMRDAKGRTHFTFFT